MTPAEPDVWSQADVDAAAEHFEDCQIFTPYAAMCEALGCRYADFMRPLREAAERESQKYGRHVPADDQYFRDAPGSAARRDGRRWQPGRDQAGGHFSFTLCDDIREQLERGEEV